MKQYKKRTPEETIHIIRLILNDLGLLLFERHFIYGNHFSCRVSIGNNKIKELNIGTNGKGRSFEYSLASAYAEFMERLQNDLLLYGHKMLTEKTFNQFSFSDNEQHSDYLYDPKEKELLIEELDQRVQDELKRMCGLSPSDDIKIIFPSTKAEAKMTALPFYDVFSKKEVYFPIDYLLQLTGSNGMASGNSPKEAMLQAICEIFERYVVREIYDQKVIPPEISISAFKGTEIYDKLMDYRKRTGHKLIIRDCSLGLGLPAIGLAIVDMNKLTYFFKIGVDFIPAIALERCFTETFQGRKNFSGLSFNFTDINDGMIEDYNDRENNLMKLFLNGTGYWPVSVLFGNPTYEFKSFDKSYGLSNKKDLNICLEIIKKMGLNIYIRDNTSLGFPTYFVVIPGLSELTASNPVESGERFHPSFYKLKDINHLGRINKKMAKSILDGIEDNYHLMKKLDFDLKHVLVYHVNPDLAALTTEMLAALLAYYIGNNHTCIKYLQRFVKDKEREAFKYYYACLDFLKLSERFGQEEAIKPLTIMYGEDLANDVKKDFANPENIFQYYKLPNCPNCEKCKLLYDCREKEINSIKHRIRQVQKRYNISQLNVQKDLEDDID